MNTALALFALTYFAFLALWGIDTILRLQPVPGSLWELVKRGYRRWVRRMGIATYETK